MSTSGGMRLNKEMWHGWYRLVYREQGGSPGDERNTDGYKVA